MPFRSLLVFFFCFASSYCFAQDSLDWKKTFGNQYNDISGRSISTNDKGYLLYGMVKPNGPVNPNGFDWGIYKLDSCGNIQWQKTFTAATAFNEVYAAKQTLDNGYLLAGTSVNSSGDFPVNYGSIDPWVFKLDAAGNVLWKKNVAGSVNSDYFYSAYVLPDSSFLLGGNYDKKSDPITPLNSRDHGRLTKIDKSGNIIWDRIIDTSIIGLVWDINVFADGKILLGGFTNIAINGVQTGRSDAKMAQYSAAGVLEWNRTIRGTQSAQIRNILIDKEQHIYVTGLTNNATGEFANNHGSNDIMLYKYDHNGNKLWGKLFGGSKDDQGWDTRFTDDQTMLMTGYASSADGDFSINNGSIDAFVLTIDTSGRLLNNMNFGGTGSERVMSITVNEDKSYAIAGYAGPTSILPVNGISDLFMAKFRKIPTAVIDSFICKPIQFQNISIAKDTTLIVAPLNACGNTAYRTTYQFHYNGIDLVSIKDTAVLAGTALTLTTTSNASTTWNADALLSCTYCLSPVTRPQLPHQFVVNAVNNYCSATDTVNVSIKENPNGFYVPNAFTPNGNGVNDVLLAFGNAKYFEFSIYNRWGEMIFRSSKIAEGWNGYHKGKLQPYGSYVYKINYTLSTDNKQRMQTGTVILIP
jgi:gliding motility-associated-like protein